ncbi:MAG: PepSY-associated TM helix domain-containing protein [Oligoflexus sp.]
MKGKAKTFQKLYKWHRWLGLFLSLHLLILLATGSILVFRSELEKTFYPAPSHHIETDRKRPALSFQALLDQALEKHPNDRPLALFIDEENSELVQIRLGIDQSKQFRGARRITSDRFGQELASNSPGEKQSTLLDQVLILHREFFLGSFGKFYVALIGCLFILSLVTGLYIYGPLMKKLSFAWIRGPSLPRWSDIHKLIGVLSFAWCLLIAVSGSILAVSGTLLKIYQYTELKQLNQEFPDPGPAQSIISLDEALKMASDASPDLAFSFVSFPGNEFSTKRHFLFFMKGVTPLTEKLRTLVLVDALTGKVIEVRELPWYLQAALLSEPLHFGDYGGMSLKIIWAVLGLLSLTLPVSGLWIVWLKRRKKLAEGGLPRQLRKPRFGRAWRTKAYFFPLGIGISFTIGSFLALYSDQYGDLLALFLFIIPLLLSVGIIFSDRYHQRKKSTVINPEVHQ